MSSSINNSQDIKQRIQLLERRARAVKGSLEMLTVFEQPNLKSARCMIEDAELLLEEAKKLHAAIAAMEGK
jgi:predicted metal-dependent hydrolase